MPTLWLVRPKLLTMSCFEEHYSGAHYFYYLTLVWNTSQQNWVTPCRNEQNTYTLLPHFFLLFITFFPLNADAVKRESNKWTEERNWPNKRDLDFVCWDKAALSSWLLLKLGWSTASAQSCKNQIEILLNLQPHFMRLSFYARLRILSYWVYILLSHCWKFALKCLKHWSGLE